MQLKASGGFRLREKKKKKKSGVLASAMAGLGKYHRGGCYLIGVQRIEIFYSFFFYAVEKKIIVFNSQACYEYI